MLEQLGIVAQAISGITGGGHGSDAWRDVIGGVQIADRQRAARWSAVSSVSVSDSLALSSPSRAMTGASLLPLMVI
ncbi:hypothetical protein CU110_07075 [Cobetia sp. ICG0124]|nr:hypothetical protein CU110_07075 [Cobetia sp. ICG0124]